MSYSFSAASVGSSSPQSPIAWRAKKHVGGWFALSRAASAPGVATICPSGNNENMTVSPLSLSAHAGASLARMGRLKQNRRYFFGKARLVRPRRLERLGEPGLQEFAQLGRRLELWDRIQFFECRRKRIRKTPHRSRPEFLILRLEVKVVHGSGEVLGGFEFTLHKRLVDDHLGGDVGEFAPLPGFHLLSHRLKASLHAVDTNRDAVNERERLRVFREHRGKHA